MSEFKKLDQFVRDYKPALATPKIVRTFETRPLVPWFSIGACALALSMFLVTQATREPLYMESLYLAETVEWEIEEDSLLSYYDVL